MITGENTTAKEEKVINKEYFYHCSRCSSDSKSKQKFIAHSMSIKRGMILSCAECGKLITRRVDANGEPRIRKKKKTKEYSEEEINFLKEQFIHTFTTRRELVKIFNEKFNVNIAYSTLGMMLTKNKILKDKKFHRVIPKFYDDEKINFLKQHYKRTDTTREELIQMFNEKFKSDKTVSAIKDVLRRHKIIKDKRYQKLVNKKYKGKAKSKYTKEHTDFIRKNYTESSASMTRRELLKLFNEKFGLDIGRFQLMYIMNTYKLGRENAGRAPIYNHEVKQFLIKCIKEGLTKDECKDAMEKKFERQFNKQSMNQIANKMGLHFSIYQEIEIDKFFEEHKEIEEFIRKVVSKNPKDTYHGVLIRDAIIEKYEKNIKVSDVCLFCEIKNIKISRIGKTKKEIVNRRKENWQTRKDRKRLADNFDNFDNMDDIEDV